MTVHPDPRLGHIRSNPAGQQRMDGYMVQLLTRFRYRTSGPRQGFTLVEILVSVTMLAVGMLLMGTLMVRSARTANFAASISYQAAIAAAEANRLDAMPFAQLAAGTVCDTTTALP